MNARRRIVSLVAMSGLIGSACSSDGNEASPTAPSSSAPASVDIATTVAGSTAATTDASATSGATVSTTPATAGPGTATTAAAAPAVQPTSTTPPDPSTIAFNEIGRVDNAVAFTYRVGDDAFYIVSQFGFVVAMRDGVVDDTRLLDISNDIQSGGERGLLGLAFSLDGQAAYVNYTNSDGDTEITEYAVGPDGVFDPASKRVLLTIDQPYPNHNGGQVRVGLDGYLYIGMGDGGSGNDPDRRGLNVGELLGKILRIDPTASGDSPYSIPPDNPFIGVDGARPEIWAVGLRNPWRFSFDIVTDDLWIADVGQGRLEEIDVAWADEGSGRGANFGWSAFEGTSRFNDDQPEDGAVPPIWEYEHGERGCSVSGGVRYRGAAIPSLYGYYAYADYCNGEVRALEIRDDRTAGTEVILTDEIAGISEVAQGPDGELYVLSVDDGTVHAVQPGG